MCVYGAHVLVAVLLAVTDVLPAPDAAYYDQIAQWRLDYWQGRISFPPDANASKNGFPTLLAVLYAGMGRHPFYGALVNSLFATGAGVLIARTCQRIGWAKAARRALLLTLLPGFMLWSGLALREAGVWLLTAAILYAGACFIDGDRVTAAWFGVAGALGLATFRGSLMPVLVVAVMVGVYLSRKKATGMATAGAVLILTATLLVGSRTGALSSLSNESQLNASRASLATANSGFAATAYSSTSGALSQLPVTLPRVAFGPYPTAWLTVNTITPIIWAVWIWLLVNAVIGFRVTRSARARWLFVPPAAMLSVVIAITSGNWGTLVRIRDQVALILLPLAAVAMAQRNARRNAPKPPSRPGRRRSSLRQDKPFVASVVELDRLPRRVQGKRTARRK